MLWRFRSSLALLMNVHSQHGHCCLRDLSVWAPGHLSPCVLHTLLTCARTDAASKASPSLISQISIYVGRNLEPGVYTGVVGENHKKEWRFSHLRDSLSRCWGRQSKLNYLFQPTFINARQTWVFNIALCFLLHVRPPSWHDITCGKAL